MQRSIPLLLLGLADLVLGVRWLWLGGGVIGHADGMGDGMVGMAILLAGFVTTAIGAVLLTVSRRAKRLNGGIYLLAVALSLVMGGLPWLAFATIP